MSELNPVTRPHSSEYFGEERDHFWNDDYLDLLARRLDLRSITSLVDVGCGVGHWGALLYPRLAPGAELVGVDGNAENVSGFRRRVGAMLPPDARARAIEGDALALPLPDAAFDAATCQTLLIHLGDPAGAVREMARITRAGGLILCAEPNNIVARFPDAWAAEHVSPECLARLSEMAWRYGLGRARRGLGREYLGELLPGLLAEIGLQNIRVWLCDKALPMVPPYALTGERATLAAFERWRSEGSGPFDRAEVRANVLAGGGTEAFFEAAWADYLARDQDMLRAMNEGRWSSAGGGLFYVVAGQVPSMR